MVFTHLIAILLAYSVLMQWDWVPVLVHIVHRSGHYSIGEAIKHLWHHVVLFAACDFHMLMSFYSVPDTGSEHD